ncbi:MAG: transcriptional regulator GcvA [Parasphingopyxis sp.]|nr:transcriptional regulator GcvA [Sphingomonadales bacterium]
MRRLPPLAAIRAFEAAARQENFTKAADELGMTQAAVSYQVKSLEQAVGAPLFLRERGRVRLTEAGAQLALQVTAAFETLDEAFDRLRIDEEATLGVSTLTSLALRWLAPRLGGFQLARPALAVRLDVGDRLTDFARDDVDVAVRAGRGEWPGLHSRFLMRAPFAPMASPGFVAAHGPLDTPRAILASRLLSPDDVWWKRWAAEAGFGGMPPPPVPGVRYDSQPIEGSAAIAGQGIAMLNPVFWHDELRDGRLVQLGETLLGKLGYWVVCPEHKRNQPKVKAFRDWIIAEAEADPLAELIRVPPE